MREVRAEHVRHLVVRQLQVARRAVADADGLRPAVGADAERARAGDGGARRTRDEVRYIVRVEVQRAARGDLHLARAARVLDRARRERDLVVRPRTIRADLEAARADDRLARLRRLDDDAVVRLKAVDRDGVAPLVAEDKLRELVAEELAVELLARDVESRARCIVVERQVALRLSRDDEATLADDVRRIVVRRRRDDLVRVHAKSADRVRAGVELRPCVKLHVVSRNIDPDRRRAINNLYLGVLIQNDIAAARVERRLCVVALDLECSPLLQVNIAVRLDVDLRAVVPRCSAIALDVDGLSLFHGEAARDDRIRIVARLRRIRADLELRPLPHNGDIILYHDAKPARRVNGLLDGAAVEIEVLIARDVEAAEAVERLVDRAIGDAELPVRCVRSIVANDDILRVRRALRLDLAALGALDLAEAEVDAAREVEVEVLDGERIARVRQLRRLRLDLHVGLAVRARLVRSFELDMARRLDVRRILEGRVLDLDVAALAVAADLDIAVLGVVDVPVVRARADADRLRLVALFERERLFDVDLVAEVHVVGFELCIVLRLDLLFDVELLARIELDMRGLRLDALDVLLGIDVAVLDLGDLHIGLVGQRERSRVREVGGNVPDLVVLRVNHHVALAEEEELADLEARRRCLRQSDAVHGERVRRRAMHRAGEGEGAVRQDARILRQSRDLADRRRARVVLRADGDVVEVSCRQLADGRIREEGARAADREVARRLFLHSKNARSGERAIQTHGIGGDLRLARSCGKGRSRIEVHGASRERHVLVVRVRDRARDLDRVAGDDGERRLDGGRADLDVARLGIADLHRARARIDEGEVRHGDIRRRRRRRRIDRHRLARRPRLDRDRAVRTRKDAGLSRRERQRIRLDIDRSAGGLDLRPRAEGDAVCLEGGLSRTGRGDLSAVFYCERSRSLELQCARAVLERRRAARQRRRAADREIARDVDIRAARARHETRLSADRKVAAVLEGELLRLAVDVLDRVRAREADLGIRRVEPQRIGRDFARARNLPLRGERQRMARSDVHRTADRHRARARVQFEVAVRRDAADGDVRLLAYVADDVLVEVRDLARAGERIAREVESARARAEVDRASVRERPDLRIACGIVVARDLSLEVDGVRAQLDRARRDARSAVDGDALGDRCIAARRLADERDLARARPDRRTGEQNARRIRRRAARHLDVAARRARRARRVDPGVDRDAVQRDARFARALGVGEADAVIHEAAADLHAAAERLDADARPTRLALYGDAAARLAVRIGRDLKAQLARRRCRRCGRLRRDVGVDVDGARRLETQRHVAARRLSDGVRDGDGVVVLPREVVRLDVHGGAVIQRVGDLLHVRHRVALQGVARQARLDLDVARVDQPFARLAALGGGAHVARDPDLRARGLDHAARALASAARRDLAREARLAVRPDGDGAACAAVRRRVGAQSRAVLNIDVLGVRERPRTLPAAADLDRAALHAARIRQAARAEVHVTRRDTDRARRVCEGGGTDDAVLIDRRAREHFTRRRRHKDKASVCLDETFVRDRLLQCRLCGDDLDLAVAAKVECDRFARGESRRALLRDDDTLVDDVLAEEGDEPAVLGGERCLVDDLAVVLCADEVVASRHEVRVRDVHGGGDDRARIDLCARGEVDARRVDEEDASVRL